MPINPAEVSYDISYSPPATPEGVADFLGRPGDLAVLEQAVRCLPLVANMVRGYVRGRGFTGQEAVPELAAVIVTATARLVLNPTGETYQAVGPFVTRPGTLTGFTLVELYTLNRYRRRAA